MPHPVDGQLELFSPEMHAPFQSGEPSEPDHCEQDTSWNEPSKAPCPVKFMSTFHTALETLSNIWELTAWEERVGSSSVLTNIETTTTINLTAAPPESLDMTYWTG